MEHSIKISRKATIARFVIQLGIGMALFLFTVATAILLKFTLLANTHLTKSAPTDALIFWIGIVIGLWSLATLVVLPSQLRGLWKKIQSQREELNSPQLDLNSRFIIFRFRKVIKFLKAIKLEEHPSLKAEVIRFTDFWELLIIGFLLPLHFMASPTEAILILSTIVMIAIKMKSIILLRYY